MKRLLKEKYGLEVLSTTKSAIGAGSDTYFVSCVDGKYVVKYPSSNNINHPKLEIELCKYLNAQNIPVC